MAYQKLYMWKGFRHLRHTRSSNISKTKNTSYAVILWGTRESVFFWIQKKNILSDGFPCAAGWSQSTQGNRSQEGSHISTHAMTVNSVAGRRRLSWPSGDVQCKDFDTYGMPEDLMSIHKNPPRLKSPLDACKNVLCSPFRPTPQKHILNQS